MGCHALLLLLRRLGVTNNQDWECKRNFAFLGEIINSLFDMLTLSIHEYLLVGVSYQLVIEHGSLELRKVLG